MCDEKKRPADPAQPEPKPKRDVDDLIFHGEQGRQVSDR